MNPLKCFKQTTSYETLYAQSQNMIRVRVTWRETGGLGFTKIKLSL